jgi:hypothetical protein
VRLPDWVTDFAIDTVAVGDTFPDGPRAKQGFGIWRVRQLDANRALVLHSRRDVISGREIADDASAGTPFIDCSWAFVLVPAHTSTRLRLRKQRVEKSSVSRG